jgi:ATPase family associated with various cellular activities (AAA)
VAGVCPDRPEFADAARLARRLLRRTVRAARTQDAPVQDLLGSHLGAEFAGVPVVGGNWRGYDHVNLQAGLDAWLAAPGRAHELAGLTGFRQKEFGLADLLQPGGHGGGPGMGSVAMVARPAGPGGETRLCVQCGLYLVEEAGTRAALLLRGPDEHDWDDDARLEAACADPAAAERIIAEVRRLAIERNVFRGQVLIFGERQMFGHGRGQILTFANRPAVSRDQVILPPGVLDGIEQQILGVARQAGQLLASGLHLKRGVLLYGPPGTGKTHTISYLLSQLPEVTVMIVSALAMHYLEEACSVARVLQPSAIVIEDVDMIAEDRELAGGASPLLIELLNEMDGLGAGADVTFLLTTNRADVLETALAQRPGRIDHAAELPPPDAAGRRALIDLYKGNLVLDLADPDAVITRTEGVTASFIKELFRRAALIAGRNGGGGQTGPLRVTDAQLNAALDQLLDTRNVLTRVLLGGSRGAGA